MNQLGKNLLTEVKRSISLRTESPDVYADSFRSANSFITATINGKVEFVPLDLLAVSRNKLLVQLEVATVFGKPEERSDLDDLLIKFYKDHNLKRDINSMNSSVGYFIKPVPVLEKKKDADFFNQEDINKLAPYAGKKYQANDAFLKDLGHIFSQSVMQPTNKWGALVQPEGYVLESERYWQVAGHFKTFTWAKLTREEYQDKHVFFSVGVDVKKQEFVIKLDCLRSGTNKLSNQDIRKFDYFTGSYKCVNKLSIDYFALLNWETLTQIAREVIKELEPVYVGAIQYLFEDKLEVGNFQDRLFPMSDKYHSNATAGEGEIAEDKIYALVMLHEQFMLEQAGKPELIKFIKPTVPGQNYDIASFELDGTPKEIIVVASSGGTEAPFPLTAKQIELLHDEDHAYLYQVVEYTKDTNSGKLLVRKGNPARYALLTGKTFEARIK